MRTSLTMAVALMATALATTTALAGGNVNFLVGQRMLGEDDIEGIELEALDDQTVYGVTVDFGPSSWPVNLAVGVYLSSRDENESFGGLAVDEEVTLTEVSFGVNKTWAVSSNVRPFIGGGLTRIEGEVELDAPPLGNLDENDDAIAVYAEGGLYWRLGSAFNIGGSVRAVREADMEIENADFEGDYIQGGILIGWGWGN